MDIDQKSDTSLGEHLSLSDEATDQSLINKEDAPSFAVEVSEPIKEENNI